MDALIDERFIDLHEHHTAVHTADQRSRLDVESRHWRIAKLVCRRVTLEVELADQAVAPLLGGVVGALGRRKRLCSGRSTGDKPIGPAERTGGGGGKAVDIGIYPTAVVLTPDALGTAEARAVVGQRRPSR